MDYSLYIAVESYQNNDDVNNRNKYVSKDGQELYHIGIIDYLQTWNAAKRVERASKQLFKNQKGSLISAIEPSVY